MGREHRVINVYNRHIDNVENAIDCAMTHHGAESESEALAMLAAAYTGEDQADVL